MNRFAIAQTSDRLAALELQARQCLVSCDPEAVHRLRVATRRLQSCLQTFESALPKKRARNFGKRLHQARSVAGGVRDCDIALELIGQCSPPQDSLLELLRRSREEGSLELGALLESWQEEDFLERRRKKLHLESAPSCDDESIRKADL
jgi:CHAD domain-containing protein